MATKAKTKARKSPAKKQTAAKTAPRKKSQPATAVQNHPFAPGSQVGFFPRSSIEVEKHASREPIPDPAKTATVAKDGGLEVRGLAGGAWTAVAQVNGRWRFFDFSVK